MNMYLIEHENGNYFSGFHPMSIIPSFSGSPRDGGAAKLYPTYQAAHQESLLIMREANTQLNIRQVTIE